MAGEERTSAPSGPLPCPESDFARIVLDRPARRNALGREHVDDVLAQLARATAAGSRVVILSARGPVFCSGADVTEFGTGAAAAATDDLLNAISTSGLYWVAAVQGVAMGVALSILAACQYVVCTHDAWFSLPKYRYGIFPEEVLGAVAGRQDPDHGPTSAAAPRAPISFPGRSNPSPGPGSSRGGTGRGHLARRRAARGTGGGSDQGRRTRRLLADTRRSGQRPDGAVARLAGRLNRWTRSNGTFGIMKVRSRVSHEAFESRCR